MKLTMPGTLRRAFHGVSDVLKKGGLSDMVAGIFFAGVFIGMCIMRILWTLSWGRAKKKERNAGSHSLDVNRFGRNPG